MKNEKEVIQYFDTVDRELARVATESTVDLDQTEALVKKHEAALQDGSGLLAAVEATNFLRTLDEHLFPGMTALGGTANANRQNHFRFERPRLALVAKENYIREHGTELSAALEKLIAFKSKNRAAWRNKLADEYLDLERKRLLDGFQNLSVLQARRLDSLEEILVASDSLYYEAIRLAQRLKIAPTLETFTDARSFSEQVKFGDAP